VSVWICVSGRKIRCQMGVREDPGDRAIHDVVNEAD